MKRTINLFINEFLPWYVEQLIHCKMSFTCHRKKISCAHGELFKSLREP